LTLKASKRKPATAKNGSSSFVICPTSKLRSANPSMRCRIYAAETYGSADFQSLFDSLSPILQKHTSYAEKSLWFDIVAEPAKHVITMVMLSKAMEGKFGRSWFSVLPIRTSYTPCYITIDKTILVQTIVGIKKPVFQYDEEKLRWWRDYFCVENKPFRAQGAFEFDGTLATDGVGLSVLKRRVKTHKMVRRATSAATTEEFSYVDNWTAEQHTEFTGKCVLIDPNRRDLLYAMHEASEPHNVCTDTLRIKVCENETHVVTVVFTINC
jgi:hypothetical protein